MKLYYKSAYVHLIIQQKVFTQLGLYVGSWGCFNNQYQTHIQ